MSKKKITFAIIVIIIIAATTKLLWLVLGVSSIAIIYLLFSSDLSQKKWYKKIKWLLLTIAFVSIFIVTISVRIFLIEVFSIPSGSMEETLFDGDIILVNKLNYGPRMPNSPYEIPWVNLFWSFNTKTSENTDSVYWDYHRLKGFSKINKGDVLVFEHPFIKKPNNFFIKRCVAIPGDTFKIQQGEIRINDQMYIEPEKVKKRYVVWSNNLEKFKISIDNLNLEGFETGHLEHHSEMQLTQLQYTMLRDDSCIDSIQIKVFPQDSIHWVFPKTKEFAWTITDYGPLIIPVKGMKINLDNRNFQLYQRTINRLEKVKLKRT